MKYIIKIMTKIRNLLPYLLLVLIYFFFVNIEARKQLIKEEENKMLKDKSSIKDNQQIIKIPVIPYQQK